MKKILSLVVLCVHFNIYAQDEQISFMGIPMNKSVESFYSSLISNGFKPSECGTFSGFEETRCCTGSWMNYNDCEIVVARNQEDENLSRVMVRISGITSLSVKNIIDHITQQYGNYSYQTKGDDYVWKVDNGGIIITDMSTFNTTVVSFHNKSEFNKMLSSFINRPQNEHVLFRGTPMDKLEDIEQNLLEGGFAYTGKSTTTSKIYKGLFGGIEDCLVTILFSPISKSVAQIVVSFPVRDEWIDLLKDFYKISMALIVKYHVPVEDKKYEFVSESCIGNELECLAKNTGISYFHMWEIPNGGISLKIDSSLRVVLRYYDDMNTDLLKKEKNKSAYTDF